MLSYPFSYSLYWGPERTMLYNDVYARFLMRSIDITERRITELALLQNEKLAAVGKLAATISHEINNPLEAVTNLLFSVRQDETVSRSSRDFLESADRELARISQVASQTLRFHRRSTAATSVRPDVLAEEVLHLYSARLSNAGIKVRREYAPGLMMTCFDADIRQDLNNLVGNATASMTPGGKLTVRTSYGKHCTRVSKRAGSKPIAVPFAWRPYNHHG